MTYGPQVNISNNLLISYIGVMLYIMLCGYPPFYGESQDEIKKRVLKGKVKFDGTLLLFNIHICF